MNKTSKTIFFAALLSLAGNLSYAQSFGDMVNQTMKKNNIDPNKFKSNGGTSAANLSSADISNGLKQALQVGVQNASKKLGAVNGYFGNSLIKVVMPPEAQKVEAALREVGMGSMVDKAILSMNRAAEDAAPKAVDIFINAIKGITIEDGLSILKGSNDAATQYLKAKTTAALTTAFRPVINNSLAKVDATKYWEQVFSAYDKLPFTSKVNPDLTAYVTERALNGLFVSIAEEETKIRSNPAARVTNLLQKVFGAR